MSEAPRDPELTAVERALGKLAPAAPGLHRDQLLFRAGQASVRRTGWWWPAATGVLVLTLAGWIGASLLRGEPQAVVQVVYVPIPPPAPSEPAERATPRTAGPLVSATADVRADESAYLHLRDRVLRLGVDALPQPPPAGPAAPGEVLDLSPRSLNQVGGLP